MIELILFLAIILIGLVGMSVAHMEARPKRYPRDLYRVAPDPTKWRR